MTTSMWDIRYPGTTKTSFTRKLLRDVFKFPLRAVLFVVPNQFYSLWPQTWVLWDTHPAVCRDCGAGGRRQPPAAPPGLRPLGRSCALHPVSAPTAPARGTPELSLPVASVHPLRGSTPRFRPFCATVSGTSLLHVARRKEIKSQSPFAGRVCMFTFPACSQFAVPAEAPSRFLPFHDGQGFVNSSFCLVFTWKICNLFLFLKF